MAGVKFYQQLVRCDLGIEQQHRVSFHRSFKNTSPVQAPLCTEQQLYRSSQRLITPFNQSSLLNKYNCLQKHDFLFTLHTLCHIRAANINVFCWNFMRMTNTKWYTSKKKKKYIFFFSTNKKLKSAVCKSINPPELIHCENPFCCNHSCESFGVRLYQLCTSRGWNFFPILLRNSSSSLRLNGERLCTAVLRSFYRFLTDSTSTANPLWAVSDAQMGLQCLSASLTCQSVSGLRSAAPQSETNPCCWWARPPVCRQVCVPANVGFQEPGSRLPSLWPSRLHRSQT